MPAWRYAAWISTTSWVTDIPLEGLALWSRALCDGLSPLSEVEPSTLKMSSGPTMFQRRLRLFPSFVDHHNKKAKTRNDKRQACRLNQISRRAIQAMNRKRLTTHHATQGEPYLKQLAHTSLLRCIRRVHWRLFAVEIPATSHQKPKTSPFVEIPRLNFHKKRKAGLFHFIFR